MQDKQNKTKKNQLKENILELVRCYDQLSHNTCGSGHGATTNKLPRGGKTKLFKYLLNLISTHFFCLTKAPLITKMARIAIKQMEDEKKT